jgi:hypothetical protein
MTDVARFTELLFADQTLDDLVTSLDQEAAPDGAWIFLAEAAEHLRQGDIGRAAEVLLEVAGNPKMETRILLWSWAALRRLGVQPKSDESDDIKGVVIEVPMESGMDVLAAYADRSARYVNYSGRVIVWEIADVTISSIIRELLQSCEDLRRVVIPAPHADCLEHLIRVTLLTFKGNQVVATCMQSLDRSPIKQVVSVGAELVANLVKRSQLTDQIVSEISTLGNPTASKGFRSS